MFDGGSCIPDICVEYYISPVLSPNITIVENHVLVAMNSVVLKITAALMVPVNHPGAMSLPKSSPFIFQTS